MKKVTPFIMFNNNATEAMKFYSSVFKDSKVNAAPGEDGKITSGSFEVGGQDFMFFDGGPHFTFSEGISLFVNCEDQGQVDYYWEKLTSDGGEESQCGWLKDKFGVSWQIVPKALGEYLGDADREKANRALQSMLKMKKIEVAKLKEAFDSE